MKAHSNELGEFRNDLLRSVGEYPSGEPISNIELIAERLRAQKSTSLQKGITPDLLPMHQAAGVPIQKAGSNVMTGGGQTGAELAAGYQGTGHYQPQDRNAGIVEMFPELQLRLFDLLENKLPIRQTTVLHPLIGRETDIGFNAYRHTGFSETGSPGRFTNTIEEDDRYHVCLHGVRGDHSFLVPYIQQSWRLPTADKHMIRNLRKLLPQYLNMELWTGYRDASLRGGVGSDYTRFDGIVQMALGYRATYDWTVIDLNGAKLTAGKIDEALQNLTSASKGRLKLLLDQTKTGAQVKSRGFAQNVTGLCDQTQWKHLKEEAKQRFIDNTPGGYRRASGFAWDGVVYTDSGDMVFSPEVWLDDYYHYNETAPTVANPTDSGIPTPSAVSIAILDADGAGGRPSSSHFVTHGNHDDDIYIRACYRGPKGIGISTAAVGSVNMASAASKCIEISVDPGAADLSDVTSILVWMSYTDNTAATCYYLREFPLDGAGVTTVYDDGAFLPNTKPAYITASGPGTAPGIQLCKLLGFTEIDMAMYLLQYRKALVWGGVPVTNNPRYNILFINGGDN